MVLFSLLCRSSSATPVEPRPFLSADRLANGPLPEPLFAVSLRRSSALICITSHMHNHHLQWHRAGSHWYPPFCDFKVEHHLSALSCCRLSTRGVRMRFRESTIHHLYIVINTSCPHRITPPSNMSISMVSLFSLTTQYFTASSCPQFPGSEYPTLPV
jgi:hypothetical protein